MLTENAFVAPIGIVKFGELIAGKFKLKYGNRCAERLAKAIGVSKTMINKHLADNKWWKNYVKLACEVADVAFRDLKDSGSGGVVYVENELQQTYIVQKWVTEANITAGTPDSGPGTLEDALERMEVAEDREAAMNEVLGAVALDRPAFLATIAEGVVPGALQVPERPAGRRAALYGAHDRGMQILFVTPCDKRVE